MPLTIPWTGLIKLQLSGTSVHAHIYHMAPNLRCIIIAVVTWCKTSRNMLSQHITMAKDFLQPSLYWSPPIFLVSSLYWSPLSLWSLMLMRLVSACEMHVWNYICASKICHHMLYTSLAPRLFFCGGGKMVQSVCNMCKNLSKTVR